MVRSRLDKFFSSKDSESSPKNVQMLIESTKLLYEYMEKISGMFEDLSNNFKKINVRMDKLEKQIESSKSPYPETLPQPPDMKSKADPLASLSSFKPENPVISSLPPNERDVQSELRGVLRGGSPKLMTVADGKKIEARSLRQAVHDEFKSAAANVQFAGKSLHETQPQPVQPIVQENPEVFLKEQLTRDLEKSLAEIKKKFDK